LFQAQLPKFIRLCNSPIQRLIGGATNGDEFGGDCVAITASCTKPLLNSISAAADAKSLFTAQTAPPSAFSQSQVIILTQHIAEHNNNPLAGQLSRGRTRGLRLGHCFLHPFLHKALLFKVDALESETAQK